MGKFKVGDKVKVKEVEAGTISHGYTFANGMSECIGKEFTIEKDHGCGAYWLESTWYFWAEDWLEPVEPETIVIYRNGDKTIAVDKIAGKKAEAKCSKDDTYDFYTGAKIAFERLIGEDKAKEEPKPKLYNGKVVCVKSLCVSITKGKIYEFKDGYSKYDNGARMPCMFDAATSFEDLENKIDGKFIELVEN